MAARKLDHRASRRTALDAQKRAAIVSAVERGLSVSRAAATIGVCRSTVAKWRERYPEFDEEIFQAESRCIQRLTDNITTAAENDWRAAAHLLSARWPRENSERMQANADAAQSKPAYEGLKQIEERLIRGEFPLMEEALRGLLDEIQHPPLELVENSRSAEGTLLLRT